MNLRFDFGQKQKVHMFDMMNKILLLGYKFEQK